MRKTTSAGSRGAESDTSKLRAQAPLHSGGLLGHAIASVYVCGPMLQKPAGKPMK